MDFKKLTEELKHKEKSLDDLVSYIKTRSNDRVSNYTLLLGAGASVTSGIRSGAELVNCWREEIFKKENTGESYDESKAKEYLISNHSNWYSLSNEYSALFEYKFDLPSQRRLFVESEVDGKLPSIGYYYLVSLARNHYFNTIYTTNFDDLLNEAFYQFSQTRPQVCAHDSSLDSISINATRPKIIKLHGDYLYDDIKSTLRETESLQSNTKEKLIQFSKEFGLIVLGYAGNDRSVMDVLNHLLKSESYLKNGVYWCIRKGDTINPELVKLLWKEKVYFVPIDGFDEALATIHHKLLDGFSLEESFSNSKKEQIINFFTKDDFELSERSEIIKNDLLGLKKHKYSQDISDLIRDLNEKEFKGSEEDLKIALNIDRLLKGKKYSEAINLLQSHIESVDSDAAKEFYTKKLVKAYLSMEKYSEASKLCDELIELDKWNESNHQLKARCITDIGKKCAFLKDSNNQFLTSYSFLNFTVRFALLEKANSKGKPIFSDDAIETLINKSLELEPSPENPAHIQKLNFLQMKREGIIEHKQKKSINEQIEKHVDRLKEVNSQSLNYLRTSVSQTYINSNYEKIQKGFSHIISVAERSPRKQRQELLEIILDRYPAIGEFDNSESFTKDWTEFLQSDVVKKIKKKNSISLLICEAKFQLMVERDHFKSLEIMRKAKGMEESALYASTIVNFLSDLSESTTEADEYLEKIKDSLSKLEYYELKASTLVNRREYSSAIEALNQSYELGMSLDSYLIKSSYTYLLSKDWVRAVNLIENNIEYISDWSTRDTLTINKELARKSNGEKINDSAVTSVISHQNGKGLVIAAHCLLGKEAKAKRLIKESIETDYSNYYYFKTWPVIPQEYLAEFDINSESSSNIVNLN